MRECLKGKVCRTCKVWKPGDEFSKRTVNDKLYLASDCHVCHAVVMRGKSAQYHREHSEEIRERRAKEWYKTLYQLAKTKARDTSVPFDITPEHLQKLFEKQVGRCYWLGIELVPTVDVRDPQQPSLDRLVTEKGYVKGNVVITSFFANMGRNMCPVNRFEEFVLGLQEHYERGTISASTHGKQPSIKQGE